jgi:hypothetical protein
VHFFFVSIILFVPHNRQNELEPIHPLSLVVWLERAGHSNRPKQTRIIYMNMSESVFESHQFSPSNSFERKQLAKKERNLSSSIARAIPNWYIRKLTPPTNRTNRRTTTHTNYCIIVSVCVQETFWFPPENLYLCISGPYFTSRIQRVTRSTYIYLSLLEEEHSRMIPIHIE